MRHTHTFRVRYCDIDALGTYYNSRALEWFESGRTELCRASGTPYTEWEKRGVTLPLVEAHVEYLGRAQYDDLLAITVTVRKEGRARLRFDAVVVQSQTAVPVCRGYTVHVVADMAGKPIRPPQWLLEIVERKT